MKIGIAGTGRMGAAIAQRLMSVGHDVTVWNRTPAKTKPLARAGAKVAVSAARARERVRGRDHHPHRRRGDRRDLRRRGGTARRRREGQALHRDEHGAARDDREARGEGESEGRGARRLPGRRLDRPGARRQALRLRRRRATPTSRARSRSSTRCAAGSSTSARSAAGARMKLAINLPLLVYWQSLGEALALERAARARSGARHRHPHRHLGRAEHAQDRAAPRSRPRCSGKDVTPVTFDVDSIRKDLRTMIEEGARARRRAAGDRARAGVLRPRVARGPRRGGLHEAAGVLGRARRASPGLIGAAPRPNMGPAKDPAL